MNITFGPIQSRRFGLSLGVDLSPSKKQCNFDCVYCELKGSRSMDSMSEIIALDKILESVKQALLQHTNIDVLTLTANGEPTLYPYLQELISNIRIILPDSIRLLLLTNGSLLWKKELRSILLDLDIVKFSCDSLNEKAFKHIDRPHKSLKLTHIKEGIECFCAEFKGEIVAEVLFVKGINDDFMQAREIASFLSRLNITRVDIGSIDRPPAYKVEAVSNEKLQELASIFLEYKNLHVSLPTRANTGISDTSLKRQMGKKTCYHDSQSLIDTLKRRPLSIQDVQELFDKETLALLDSLCQKNIVSTYNMGDTTFYQVSLS